MASINIGANTMKLESASPDAILVSFWIIILTCQHKSMNIGKKASSAIGNIGNIRNYLDQPTAEKLVHAFETSTIDFCYCLLFGLSKKQLV